MIVHVASSRHVTQAQRETGRAKDTGPGTAYLSPDGCHLNVFVAYKRIKNVRSAALSHAVI